MRRVDRSCRRTPSGVMSVRRHGTASHGHDLRARRCAHWRATSRAGSHSDARSSRSRHTRATRAASSRRSEGTQLADTTADRVAARGEQPVLGVSEQEAGPVPLLPLIPDHRQAFRPALPAWCFCSRLGRSHRQRPDHSTIGPKHVARERVGVDQNKPQPVDREMLPGSRAHHADRTIGEKLMRNAVADERVDGLADGL